MSSTEQFEWFAHCCLDVDTSEVLPSFLKEGSEEVDAHKNVLSDLIFGHGLVSDGD